MPGHFPRDAFALARFDGLPLYEHPDPRRGDQPDWGTHVFDFGRLEVRNFLVANALYWLEEFHIDGLRVDAVASMLYLDYSRKDGEWIPNVHGGREHLEAIGLLQEANATAYKRVPGIVTIAEESTSWPGVTKATSGGGLGFGLKWNMGWMNDTLRYLKEEPIHRQYHHNLLTFSLMYAFSENYLLPISHDDFPHAPEALVETQRRQLRPGLTEALAPKRQGGRVVEAEDPLPGERNPEALPQILHDRRARKHPARKDIAANEIELPAVIVKVLVFDRDDLQAGPATRRQSLPDLPEEGRPESLPDGFEHFDGYDPVVDAVFVPIIQKLDLDLVGEPRVGDPIGRELELLAGDGQARDATTDFLGGEFRKAAPTAADLQDMVESRMSAASASALYFRVCAAARSLSPGANRADE